MFKGFSHYTVHKIAVNSMSSTFSSFLPSLRFQVRAGQLRRELREVPEGPGDPLLRGPPHPGRVRDAGVRGVGRPRTELGHDGVER